MLLYRGQLVPALHQVLCPWQAGTPDGMLMTMSIGIGIGIEGSLQPSELAAAIGHRYGLPVRPMPGGVANWCYAVGDSLVLRIARDATSAADLAREAVVIPYAIAAGVRTSSVVEHGNGHMVVTRVPGGDAATTPVAAGFYEAVGVQLAYLHNVSEVSGLRPQAPDDPTPLVVAYAKAGLIDSATADWLSAWFDKLRCPPLAPVLIHGDVAEQNLMVGPDGDFTGFVDWGDAELTDPAIEFAKLPLPTVVHVLRGYLGSPDLGDWPARVVWHQLHWALGRLAEPAPYPGARHWTAAPYARMFSIMRFFSTPSPWADLLP
jgi:hygromycin-B 7''-O-kinase